MERTLRNAPVLLLAAALLAAAAMTLALTWHYTFLQDTWEFLMNRRQFNADAIFRPHNEHIVVIPVLFQQLFLHLFGMDTAKPEIFLLTISLLATASLLFVYVSRRVGPWLGLFAAVLILCLGPAWELLLWPFEVSLIGSILFGLAMLLALEREDRPGDLLACVFLVVSFGFSSLAIPFAVAALVVILQSPRERRWGRAFVFLVPVVLYGLWYLGWGHDAESHLSLRNVLASPRYVAEAMAVGVGNLLGLGTNPIDGATEKIWGAVLLVLILAGIAWYKLRKPTLDPRFWPVAAAAFANWFLTAFNQTGGRDPVSSRYQYASCIFLLMMAANLFSGERIGRRGILLVGVVTLLAIGPNLVVLEDGSDRFDQETAFTRVDTGVLDIARRTVAPEFQLNPEISGTPSLVDVSAGKYLEAVDEYGSPGYTPSELAAAPPEVQAQADRLLALALPLSARVLPRAGSATGKGCVVIAAGRPREVQVDPGLTRIELGPGPDAKISMRRFATSGYPVKIAAVEGGSTTVLRVPRDEAPQPWYLHVAATQSARVCS
jgi:hypothetical protein